MPNNDLTPVNITAPESVVVSPEVAAALDKTNILANTLAIEVEEFEANEWLLRYYSIKAKWTLDWFFGKPVNAKTLSDLVQKKRAASNDAHHNIAA